MVAAGTAVRVEPGDVAHTPAFERAAVDILLPTLRKSFATSILSIGVFSALLVSSDPSGMLTWLVIRAVVSVGCVIALARLAARTSGHASTMGSLVMIMGVSGAVFGLLPAFVHPEGSEWQAIIAVWIFGNQSVGTAVCAADRRVFAAAIGSVTAVGAVTMLMSGSGFALVLAGLIVLGGLYAVSVFGAVHQATASAISGQLRSEELALSLRERQSELKAANHALTALAHGDVMTGIPNRRGFVTAVVDDDRCVRGAGWLGIVDLDGFKRINDTWGHLAGDDVLVEAVRRWVVALDGAYIARIGGDEFAIVLGEDVAIESIAGRIVDALAEPVATAGGDPIELSCCVGLARFDRGEPLSDVMVRADASLYVAKHDGGAQIAIDGDRVSVPAA